MEIIAVLLALGLLVLLVVRSAPERQVRASTASTVCRVLEGSGCGGPSRPVSAPELPRQADGGIGWPRCGER